MADHTPGPWKVRNGSVYHAHMFGNGWDDIPIAKMDRETRETGPTERDANATLIAAAPELLKALEAILPEFIADKVDQSMCADPSTLARIERAKDAVSKATGEVKIYA